MVSMEKKQKIDSLQVLRTFAFLGIFTSHSHIFPPLGAWGVSVFFILSGFLMSYNYVERELEYGFLFSLKFSLLKIKKLYLLHIIMTLAAIPYQLYITENLKSIKTIGILISKLLLNLTLLQTWSPYLSWYGSFNGVSWFLSVLMFCYFVFPLVLHFLCKINKTISLILIMLVIYIVQILFAYYTRNCIFDAGEFWGNYYFAYTFPFFRLGDFIIGSVLGMLFIRYKTNNFGTFCSTIIELITCFCIIGSAFIYENRLGIFGSNWFRLSLLWLPTSCFIIYICAKEQGYITKILTKPIIVKFGNKTNSYFLIHNMVIVYVLLIVRHYCSANNNLIFYCLVAIINMGIIILLEILYGKVRNRINKMIIYKEIENDNIHKS